MENFRVTPTLPTLAKLGVKMSELVDGLDKKPKLCVVRRNQRETIERDGAGEGGRNIVYHPLAHARRIAPWTL